ncbi:Dyp-type peroxidase [Marinitenerispora sediminis]|uniref:Peroxidase n=1 Tax=Marinitenerispora sediminis TaxID=1931232 RepID=A0A368T2N1_9ACTN|nr:Dyp-type peroxidase [Marinitenerispora sediminis]RCV48217.1 peroxidase [Marinitenerispora sediminis]RCV48976.1 peroxidase [Marinitenerispora sediminis]RCV55326.1 peroxidase [Marinitenerispora sediminis]
MEPDHGTRPRPPRRGALTRRLLLGGAAAGAGAATLVGADALLRSSRPDAPAPADDPGLNGERTVAFHGPRQAGIETPPQAHAKFLAVDLADDTGAEKVRRLLRLLTDDAAKLTQGQAALADSEPELAFVPARLTVTFGFGPGLVERVAPDAVPSWLRPLPEFATDRLREEWSGGDLLLQICSDDPLTVSHAARMLSKDVRAFGGLRWAQDGFRRAHGSEAPGTTMRNLMGQVDGTVNLEPGSADFEELVWGRRDNPAWLRDGTGMVVRRIAMDLDTWDRLDRPGREEAVGRRLADGAPLTGEHEHDEPDFEALTPLGFPRIAEYAHIRRARSDDPAERVFRRGYNYDVPVAGDAGQDAGLLFVSYQADVERQFVPIQRRLDELDLLNEWISPIGSAVFAVPPGCAEGGFVGETLFER